MKKERKHFIIPLAIMVLFLMFIYSFRNEDTLTASSVCRSTNPFSYIFKINTTLDKGLESFTSTPANLTYYTSNSGPFIYIGLGTTFRSFLFFTPKDKVTDIDGNIYDTIHIGTQIWLKQNLKVTHYRNGDPISNVTDYTLWDKLTTGAYSDYGNLASNGIVYGHLYNYYAVIDPRNICPAGWHVSNDAEWTTLTTFLGGDYVSGGKLKEADTLHWKSPNTGATNESGFTALPGGYFSSYIGKLGMWWALKEQSPDLPWYRFMFFKDTRVLSNLTSKNDGLSVRCVKDK